MQIYVDKLYQWDLNRKVKIDSCANEIIDEIHFRHPTDDCALVVEYKNGEVDIPNVLLQHKRDIHMYIVYADQTQSDHVFKVTPRQKPADYVYTETEVLSYKALEDRIVELENGASAIIEVPQLPERDIVKNAVYRLVTGTFCTRQGDEVITENSRHCRVVDGLPDKGECVTNEVLDYFIFYYNLQDETVYGYIDEDHMWSNIFSPGWHTYTEIGDTTGEGEFEDIVYDKNQISTENIYLLLENTLYEYVGVWKPIGVDDEKISRAVNDYLAENPVKPGATEEQAEQIKKNKEDISRLSKEKVDGIGITSIRAITQEEYDALETKDSTTLYIITDATDTEGGGEDSGNSGGSGGSGGSGDSGDSGENETTPTEYTITNNLTHVSTNNNATSVYEGNVYTAILTVDTDYNIDSVVVTMGGVDVTSTVYSDRTINISSVTGNVVITATAKTDKVSVPYITGDGASYINTGYTPTLDYTYEVTFKDYGCESNTGIMGAYGNGVLGEGSPWLVANHNSKRVSYKLPKVDNTMYTIKRTPSECFVNGVSVGTSTPANRFDNPQNLLIFKGANDTYPIAKFYGAKIWEGESLVHDFIPAKDSSGVACVYDNVTQQYLYNSGTGTLTYGESLEVV